MKSSKKTKTEPIVEKKCKHSDAMIEFCSYAAKHMSKSNLILFKKQAQKNSSSVEEEIAKYLQIDFMFTKKENGHDN
jgi:hypothetical protein